eukprot:7887195-Pyramimonas_sp.AAC.1
MRRPILAGSAQSDAAHSFLAVRLRGRIQGSPDLRDCGADRAVCPGALTKTGSLSAAAPGGRSGVRAAAGASAQRERPGELQRPRGRRAAEP